MKIISYMLSIILYFKLKYLGNNQSILYSLVGVIIPEYESLEECIVVY